MKTKKVIILIVTLLICASLIFLIFFNKNTAKKIKIGNNTTSQEIVDNILNIGSYETEIEVVVKSNKRENKYLIKQKYSSAEENMQEVIEPTNIAGVKIIKGSKSLKLENTDLNLTSVFENYEYISDNSLDLSSFIEDYKQDKQANFKEKEENIIMETCNKNDDAQKKTLYINKASGKPEKLEIKDTNKNIAVYILYNEVTVNS